MNLRNWLLASLLAVLGASTAAAEKPSPVLEMNAVGEVRIEPDGHVGDYRLDSKLVPAIAKVIDRAVRGWVFEPILVDGKAVAARTTLNMGLKAEPVEGKGDYLLRITHVIFGAPKRLAGVKPPRYPRELVRAHTGGKVTLALRVDESGDVIEALPYQSGLDRDDFTAGDAQRYRRLLEEAALGAATHWHFNPGEEVDGKPIGASVLMPLEFSVCAMPCAPQSNDRWRRFFLGPVQPVPWLREENPGLDQQVAALGDGEALSLDSRFKLRDEVIGKTL